ncbi:MAG: adenylosuccinate synthase [Bacteroidales bacterium]|nr:adenylosuccinate synthase [Bacteroidales bacterium]
MKLDVLLGLQWGDEGKGKIVDVLSPEYDTIARFQGGPNAGHTLEIGKIKHILHNIPSGIFHKEKVNIIGNGVVLDPIIFQEEVESLKKFGIDVKQNLLISKKAHLILPTHKILDAASEAAKGKSKIGSTLKGIGPTYMDKTGRNGLRVGDIIKGFKEKYSALRKKHEGLLKLYTYEYELDEIENKWFECIELLKEFKIVDSEHLVNKLIKNGKSILAEGAQGTMLDIEFGSYPFVTSSNTICAGACTGLGVSPQTIGEVFGIFKAYCTRVGSGPFPTELTDDTGNRLRKKGAEFGSTTGRPRRCGWIDLVALKYSIMLNGVTQLIMTKADVLSDFETIKVATAYKINGNIVYDFPFETDNNIEPIYIELAGWKKDISNITIPGEFPTELTNYISYLEKELNVPVSYVSVGPKRNQIVKL